MDSASLLRETLHVRVEPEQRRPVQKGQDGRKHGTAIPEVPTHVWNLRESWSDHIEKLPCGLDRVNQPEGPGHVRTGIAEVGARFDQEIDTILFGQVLQQRPFYRRGERGAGAPLDPAKTYDPRRE